MNDLLKRCSIAFGILSLLMIASSLTVHAASYPVDGKTMTLPKKVFDEKGKAEDKGEAISLLDGNQTLEGLVDRVELYYEVPLQGVKDKSELNLHLQYSDLLLKDSSITVLIDDHPIESTKLKKDKDEMKLQVPLKGDAVSQGVHKVTIAFYGQLSEEICTNKENPGNWLTVLADSYLFLDTEEMAKRKNVLEDYPYPFIQSGEDQTVKSTIVIPDESSASIMNASLRLANYLDQQAADEEEITIMKESDVKKISTNLIAIGTEDQWTGIMKDIFQAASLEIPKKELVIDNYFLEFPKAMKQALLVTGSDDQTIADKIAVLTEEHLVEQLAGDSMTLDQLPSSPEVKVKQNHSFSELNIPDQTLTGEQTSSQTYFYQIPTYMNASEDGVLHLKLNLSETLFKQIKEQNPEAEHPELVIYLNDIPHSIAIDHLDKQNQDDTYDVDIPIESNILQEEPYLKIQFQAHGLQNQDYCAPPNDDKWMFIREDSFVEIGTEKGEADLSALSSWPAPFVSMANSNEVVILLPDKMDQSMINQLQFLTNELGDYGQWNDIELLSNENVNEEELQNRHVIVVGTVAEHPILQQYANDLLVDVSESDQIDLSKFRFINETSKNVAWIQPSIWSEDHTMAVFTSVHDDNEELVSNNIINYINTNKTNTDIIVESMNGEIFTHEKESEVNQDEEEIHEGETSTPSSIGNGWLIGGLIGILLLGVTIFIYVYRKRHKE